jgi:hypothetical protein
MGVANDQSEEWQRKGATLSDKPLGRDCQTGPTHPGR